MPVVILSNYLEKTSQDEWERRYGFGKETTNAKAHKAPAAARNFFPFNRVSASLQSAGAPPVPEAQTKDIWPIPVVLRRI